VTNLPQLDVNPVEFWICVYGIAAMLIVAIEGLTLIYRAAVGTQRIREVTRHPEGSGEHDG
jgi:hypothetical protein